MKEIIKKRPKAACNMITMLLHQEQIIYFVESFNPVFREECLNENYFESLSEAKQIIESWRIDYNENRPQKGLKRLTPKQFKTKLKSTKNSP